MASGLWPFAGDAIAVAVRESHAIGVKFFRILPCNKMSDGKFIGLFKQISPGTHRARLRPLTDSCGVRITPKMRVKHENPIIEINASLHRAV
jgi:hypothetical protein